MEEPAAPLHPPELKALRPGEASGGSEVRKQKELQAEFGRRSQSVGGRNLVQRVVAEQQRNAAREVALEAAERSKRQRAEQRAEQRAGLPAQRTRPAAGQATGQAAGQAAGRPADRAASEARAAEEQGQGMVELEAPLRCTARPPRGAH